MALPIPKDARRILPEPLRKLTTEIFQEIGCPKADADRIADCLVQVDLRGVFSHGTRQVREYVNRYRNGVMATTPNIRLIRETDSTAVIDGGAGIGYLAATRATEAAIEKVEKHGVAVGASRYHGHVGSCGIYIRMALEESLVAIAVAGGAPWGKPSEPEATVWDAMQAPPMSFGIPSEEGPPLVVDMSTNFFRNQEHMEEALKNHAESVLKSMGLMFVSTILGGSLAGFGPDSERDKSYTHAGRGFLIVVVHPDFVGNADYLKSEVTRIITSSRELNPLPGFETAEVAGSLEWQRERDWAKDGIPMADDHLKALEETAGELGVKVPW